MRSTKLHITGIFILFFSILGLYGDAVLVRKTIKGNAKNNIIEGGPEPNIIYGFEGDDVLYGNGGDDNLYGGLGNDRLFGGAGNDVLEGGFGTDELRGGPGADLFLGWVKFHHDGSVEVEPCYSLMSQIKDFNPHEGDRLETCS